MRFLKTGLLITFSLLLCFILTSCSMYMSRHHSSSMVQYLYPDTKEHIEEPAIPLLSLPLKVGIAFVPEGETRHQTLTEKDKMDLMNEVGSHFKEFEFVKSINLIPSAYLTKEGSFANLDQIKTMYGIDVVALVSYDQTQFTDEGIASITYWTIIGAYIVPGEKNDTHTMVDVAVYDINSRKMLFRAPGTSKIKSRATPVNYTEQMRADSIEGFEAASKELVSNLEIQLTLFKERIKEAPDEYQVVHKPGYTGGGSLDALFFGIFALFGGMRLWTSKKR